MPLPHPAVASSQGPLGRVIYTKLHKSTVLLQVSDHTEVTLGCPTRGPLVLRGYWAQEIWLVQQKQLILILLNFN